MRASVAALAALLAIGLLTGTAQAKTVKIHGTHSEASIKATCDKVGGSFFSDSMGYGCTKGCPYKGDKEGGRCTVECKDGKCTGSTPSLTANPKSPIGNLAGIQGLLLSPGDEVSLNPQPLPPKANLLDTQPSFSFNGPAPTGTVITPTTPPPPPPPPLVLK